MGGGLDWIKQAILAQCGPRKAPFATLLVAACCGCLADRMWGQSLSKAGFLALTVTGVLCAAWGLAISGVPLHNAIRGSTRATLAALVATTLLFAAWHHTHWWWLRRDDVARLAPLDGLQTVAVQLRGKIVSWIAESPPEETFPGREQPASRFQVRVTRVRSTGRWYRASGIVWVHVVGSLQEVGPGDSIDVSGRLGRYPLPGNPGQRDIRREHRLRCEYAYLRVAVPAAVRLIRPAGRFDPRSIFLRLNQGGAQRLQQTLHPDVCGLAMAMLLGRRDQLTDQQRDRYLHTGTIHLLAISGLHVGILASFLVFAVRGRLLPYRAGLILVILLLGGYAAVTGTRTPVLRASFLIQMTCLGWLTYRRNSLTNSLCLAALIVLIRLPTDLFSVGTQLSFLAVATLGCLGHGFSSVVPDDPLERLRWRSRSPFYRAGRLTAVRTIQALVASAAVWAVTMPLIWYHYHLITPIAILLNLILWLPLACSLLAGFVILMLPAWAAWPTAMAAKLCEGNLRLIESIVTPFDDWSWTHVWCVAPAAWAVLACYFTLLLAGFCRSPRLRIQWLIVAQAGLLIGLMFQFGQRWRDQGQLHCTFLSVGHGTCVVLQLPDGRVWLYDAGKLGNPRPGVDWVSRYLWSQGIMRIDRLIISHLDADHYSLMPGLVERFVVGAVWCSQPLDTSTAGRRLQRCFAQHDIEVRRVSSGLRTRSGACELVVLQPPWEVPWDSDNANSLVLRVRYRGRSVLLPGDLEGRGLDQLLCTPVQRHTCVMLPHHGSLESRPRQFAKWAFAKRFVVSGGDAEDYQPLLSLLGLEPSGFWHTAVHGAVRWTIDQRGMDKITAVYCPPLGQGRPLAAKRRAFGNTRP